MNLISLPILFITVQCVDSFLAKGPLRNLALSRAITITLTETFAVNVFDVSAVIHEIVCDCDNNPYLPIYVGGFIVFGYLFVTQTVNDKLTNVTYYSRMKRNVRFVLLVIFLIFNKNVGSVM